MTDCHDPMAEHAMLGSALANPDHAGPILLALPHGAFWLPKNARIATVIGDLLRRGQAVDLPTVARQCQGHRDAGENVHLYLLNLLERAYTPLNASYYADRIRQCFAARSFASGLLRAQQRLSEVVSSGEDIDLGPITAELESNTETALAAVSAGEIPTVPTVLDLLDEETTYDWLVPGLLERQERLIVTGGEGFGKSVLMTQLAACFAAGLHPFTAQPLHQQYRMLVVDCENPKGLARRRYRDMLPLVEEIRSGVRDARPNWAKQLHIEFRPDGLDLLNSKDCNWLESVVAAAAPDVLAIGPIYKLHQTNINDELAGRGLTSFLDGLRHRHGCAVLSEAHAGVGEDSGGRRRMRPVGTSLFMRWPEFGYGMVRAKDAEGENPNLVDMVAWRGSRETRAWPRQLMYGGPGELPWVPSNPGYTYWANNMGVS